MALFNASTPECRLLPHTFASVNLPAPDTATEFVFGNKIRQSCVEASHGGWSAAPSFRAHRARDGQSVPCALPIDRRERRRGRAPRRNALARDRRRTPRRRYVRDAARSTATYAHARALGVQTIARSGPAAAAR